MSEKVSRNEEGYPDPTFGGAWGNMRREEKQREAERMAKINDLIPVMKQTAELAGFDNSSLASSGKAVASMVGLVGSDDSVFCWVMLGSVFAKSHR